MRNKRSNGKKIPAIILCITLCASTNTPTALSYSGSQAVTAPDMFLNQIPKQLAALQELHSNNNESNAPLILNVQDAHTNPSAQKNISSFIEWCQKNFPGNILIGMEGGQGAIHPEYLNIFKDYPELNKSIIENLSEAGELNGVERFALANPHSLERKTFVRGIENSALYRKNLEKYRQLLNVREQIDIDFLQLQKPVDALRAQLLSPELNTFLKERERRKEGKYDSKSETPQIEAYFRFLRDEASKRLSINLEDSIEQLRFPQMFNLIALEKVVENYNPEIADKERASWQNVAFEKAKSSDEKKLVAEVLELENQRNPREIVEKLWLFAAKRGMSLADYPQWQKHVGIQILRSELSAPDLWTEFSEIESMLISRMVRNANEKRLLEIQTRITSLKKLLHAELSRDEFIALAERLGSHQPVKILSDIKALKRGADARVVKSAKKLNSSFLTAVEFYRLAKKRDRVLLLNSLKSARDLHLNAGNKKMLILIVSGGFHTQGLTTGAKAYGLPYGVVQPVIDAVEPDDALMKVYRDENVDLSGFNARVELSKQQAIILSKMFTVGLDYLTTTKNFDATHAQAIIVAAAAKHPAFSESLQIQSNLPLGDDSRSVSAQSLKKSASPKQSTIAETSLLINPRRYSRQRGLFNRNAPLKKKMIVSGRSVKGKVTLTRRSEVRMSEADLTKLLTSMLLQIASQKGRNRIDQMRVALEALTHAGSSRKELIEVLEKDTNIAQFDQKTQPAAKDFLRYLKGTKIGVYGFDEASRATALLLADEGHDVTVLDTPDQLAEMTPATNQFFDRFGEHAAYDQIKTVEVADAAKADNDPAAQKSRVDRFYELLRDNDIIYIDTGLDLEGDYEIYLSHLRGRAMDFGNALNRLRTEEKNKGDVYRHKVFITRALVDERALGNVQEKLVHHGRGIKNNIPNFTDPLEFDLVYQPDFIQYEGGQLAEPYIMFGLQPINDGNPDSAALEVARREKTIELLRSIYANNQKIQPRFVSLQSAIEAKDDLIIYLATKLAFFNDLSGLSDKFGADLSIVAKGAGLDKRIQTLFANPSQAFGGRLLVLLKWIQQKQLKSFNNKTLGNSRLSAKEIYQLLGDKITELNKGGDVNAILASLPKELRRLFWIRLILSINKRSAQLFHDQKITKFFPGSLSGKKVALLGVGYSHKSGKVTESPALDLIERLITDDNVTEFYIADPQAKKDFEKWVKEKRAADEHNFGAVKFHGIGADEELSMYEAAKLSDLTIIATDANPDIFHIDLPKLKEALGNKLLIDGINLFGLRANGELANGTSSYLLQNIRSLGINYVSVGRPSITLQTQPTKDSRYLTDAKIYKSADDFPVSEIEAINDFSVALTGGGYVGLTTAGLYGELGHRVHVVDIPQAQKRIDGLNSPETIVPIYEPGLKEQIVAGKDAGKLTFSTDKTKPMTESLINILAVGTPQKDDGEIDLSYILNAAEETGAIILAMKNQSLPEIYPGIPAHFKIITIKSTVTPDTFDKIRDRLTKLGLVIGNDYALASMPEFLKEGTAVDDVRFPDRTVIGIYGSMPEKIKRFTELALLKLTYPLIKNHKHPILVTDTSTSTLIKYAANSLLAVSISLSNIFAQAAEVAKPVADYFEAIDALKSDPRITKYAFLFPGCGYGGSCFPKDVRALDSLSILEVSTLGLPLIQIADSLNKLFQDEVVDKVVNALSDYSAAQQPLKGKSIAIWGLAFKPNTDDVREAPAARMVARLLQKGASSIKLHDPIFNVQPHLREHVEKRFLEEIEKAFKELGLFNKSQGVFAHWFKQEFIATQRVLFVDNKEDALLGADQNIYADTLILATDWPQYKPLGFLTLIPSEHNFFLMDARNLWRAANDREEIAATGNVNYQGIGTPRIFSSASRPRSEVRLNIPGPTADLRSFIAAVAPKNIELKRQALTPVADLFTGKSLGNFFRQIVGREDMLRFANLIFGKAVAVEVNGQQNQIAALAKEILGADYFNLLFKVNGPAIHILTKALDNKIPEGSLLLLAAAGKNDSLTYLINGTAEDAAKIEDAFEAKAIQLGLPGSIRSNFSVIASPSPNSNATALKRNVASDLTRRIGFVDSETRFLEKVGYVRGTYRFLRERMPVDSAIALSAILLRNQLPDAMFIKNIRQELEARNLNPDVLTERMGRLIAAIQHIATQA